jgi:simple sugar transport system ATP-binding protein
VRRGLVDRKAATADTRRIIDTYDVRTPGPNVPARALSGGNQQKLIVGREMSGEPTLLIAAHPTRGVDVGAQAAIWEHIRAARSAGLAVLLISADLEELIGMSDTLSVILRGRFVGEFDPRTVTPEQLGIAMTGGEVAGATPLTKVGSAPTNGSVDAHERRGPVAALRRSRRTSMSSAGSSRIVISLTVRPRSDQLSGLEAMRVQ